MKHTYLFKATDPEVSQHRLRKIINVLRRTTTVSWKYEGDVVDIKMVQCYVDGPTVYQLLSRAGIHADVWDQLIKQARENGEPAKHTFIFKADEDITEDDLYRLARVADRSRVSWKGQMTDRLYDWVQVYTDNVTMHQICSSAGWSGEQLRLDIPKAKERGDKPVGRAQQRRPLVPSTAHKEPSDEIKKYARKDAEVVCVRVMLDRLREAGCQIEINSLSGNAYEIIVFGESFTLLDSSEARGFLAGLEKGFTSAPLWDGFKVAIKNFNQSTKATRRSKRSA